MKKTDYVYAPDGLDDLGLSQNQLCALQGYFGLQIRYARQQRRTLFGMLLVIAAAVIAQYSFGPSTLPFETLLQVALKWFPAVAAGMGFVSIGLTQYIRHLSTKALPQIGLSDDATARVRELVSMIDKAILLGLAKG